MAYIVKGRTLWRRSNQEQQDIVMFHPQYSKIINTKRPGLTRLVDPAALWPYLHKYQVLNKGTQQKLTLNATSQETVDRLLDHLESKASWRFHAFLRALSLTDQEDVIGYLGLNPGLYEGPSPPDSEDEEPPPAGAPPSAAGGVPPPPAGVPPSAAGGVPPPTSPPTVRQQHQQQQTAPFCKQTLETLSVHAQSYSQNIMQGRVFDFRHHDLGSDLYDVNDCYMQQDADIQRYHRSSDRIEMKNILKEIGKQPSPRTVLLSGQPGTGKSTFFRRFAFCWSQEFLRYLQDTKLHVCPDLSVVIYVPAQSLTTNIWESIENELCCRSDDRGFMMSRIQSVHNTSIPNSAFLVDGIDEIRNRDILNALAKFVEKTHKEGGPQVLLSARTGLSRMEASLFDRFLHLDGFELDEGLAYTHKYITLYSRNNSTQPKYHSPGNLDGQHMQSDPPVLGYINRHKDKLSAILQNPLRAHILSGLAVEELIELDDDNIVQSVELLTTMENFFIKRETEGQGVPTAERHQFYKLCLFGLLQDMREFSAENLKKFGVQDSAYVSFLRMQTKRDKLTNNVTLYSFEHEILYEFFAARAIESLGEEMKAAIVLHLCSQEIFRNLQKLVFGILSEYGTESSVPVMVGMTRLILLQQALSSYQEKEQQSQKASDGSQNSRYKEWYDFVSDLQTLFDSISSTIPTPAAILQTQDGEDALRDGDVTRLWDMVGTTFNQLTNLTKMNQSPYGEDFWVETYFTTLGGYSFVGDVLLELLSECTPQQQAEIADSSYLLMLPCYRVYPCGGRRWVDVDMGGNRIYCWSPEDAVTGLLQHRRSAAHRETTHGLYIHFTQTPSQWGRPPADSWTRAAWDSALQAAVEQYNITDLLQIYLPATYSTPLQGLLYSITHLDMAHYPHRRIEIYYGTISLSALLQWYQESGATHRRKVKMYHTTLQLPADTHSREQLLQGVGEEFVQRVRDYIVDKGLTGGELGGLHRLTDGVALIIPTITFM